MQNHHCYTKRLWGLIGHFLVFVTVFVSASFFFRAKDNADTDYLEQVSKKATETDGVADKSRTTVISFSNQVQIMDVASISEIQDTISTESVPASKNVVVISLIIMSIVTVIIVKRREQNAKHHKVSILLLFPIFAMLTIVTVCYANPVQAKTNEKLIYQKFLRKEYKKLYSGNGAKRGFYLIDLDGKGVKELVNERGKRRNWR